MEQIELVVQSRDGLGKGLARRLRAAGWVPAIFYGRHVKEPVRLSIDSKKLAHVVDTAASSLLTLKAEGNKEVNGKTAMIKDEQYDPVTQHLLHVDLVEIRMDEELKVWVPIEFVGKSKGVAEGGILQQLRRELEVKCLPTAIPEKIEIDVTELMIGHSLHVEDITFSEGVKRLDEGNFTLAVVVAPVEEEEPTPAVAADAVAVVGEEGEAPAEGEEKKEEGEKDKPEGDEKKEPEAK